MSRVMLFMICFQKPHTGEYNFLLWYTFRMKLHGLILHGKCLWHVEGVKKQVGLEMCSNCFMEQTAVVQAQILYLPTFLFLLSLQQLLPALPEQGIGHLQHY